MKSCNELDDEKQVDKSLIAVFHQMWDGFPGLARLIDKQHVVLASNKSAAETGFIEGVVCAKVLSPQAHKGCLAHTALKTKTACVDRPADNKIRGWMPLAGHDELFVHFTLAIPEGI